MVDCSYAGHLVWRALPYYSVHYYCQQCTADKATCIAMIYQTGLETMVGNLNQIKIWSLEKYDINNVINLDEPDIDDVDNDAHDDRTIHSKTMP